MSDDKKIRFVASADAASFASIRNLIRPLIEDFDRLNRAMGGQGTVKPGVAGAGVPVLGMGPTSMAPSVSGRAQTQAQGLPGLGAQNPILSQIKNQAQALKASAQAGSAAMTSMTQIVGKALDEQQKKIENVNRSLQAMQKIYDGMKDKGSQRAQALSQSIISTSAEHGQARRDLVDGYKTLSMIRGDPDPTAARHKDDGMQRDVERRNQFINRAALVQGVASGVGSLAHAYTGTRLDGVRNMANAQAVPRMLQGQWAAGDFSSNLLLRHGVTGIHGAMDNLASGVGLKQNKMRDVADYLQEDIVYGTEGMAKLGLGAGMTGDVAAIARSMVGLKGGGKASQMIAQANASRGGMSTPMGGADQAGLGQVANSVGQHAGSLATQGSAMLTGAHKAQNQQTLAAAIQELPNVSPTFTAMMSQLQGTAHLRVGAGKRHAGYGSLAPFSVGRGYALGLEESTGFASSLRGNMTNAEIFGQRGRGNGLMSAALTQEMYGMDRGQAGSILGRLSAGQQAQGFDQMAGAELENIMTRAFAFGLEDANLGAAVADAVSKGALGRGGAAFSLDRMTDVYARAGGKTMQEQGERISGVSKMDNLGRRNSYHGLMQATMFAQEMRSLGLDNSALNLSIGATSDPSQFFNYDEEVRLTGMNEDQSRAFGQKVLDHRLRPGISTDRRLRGLVQQHGGDVRAAYQAADSQQKMLFAAAYKATDDGIGSLTEAQGALDGFMGNAETRKDGKVRAMGGDAMASETVRGQNKYIDYLFKQEAGIREKYLETMRNFDPGAVLKEVETKMREAGATLMDQGVYMVKVMGPPVKTRDQSGYDGQSTEP